DVLMWEKISFVFFCANFWVLSVFIFLTTKTQKETQSTQNFIITLPHQHISTLPHHHITTSPHYHIATLSHRHIITSTNRLWYFKIAQVPGDKIGDAFFYARVGLVTQVSDQVVHVGVGGGHVAGRYGH